MLFSQIIGQKTIKERLIRTVHENRIPHAQLFRGREGVGKLALAVAYGQYICCKNRAEHDACGVCPSCVKYSKLAHPDLHLVFPIIKPANKDSLVCDDFVNEFRELFLEDPYMGARDWFNKISKDSKQGVIYSSESQEIIRKLSLKTYESEYKVMIIWLPEKMHVTCANKLLKILEEPPAKTVFLLVSDQPETIITTILSRTQHIIIPALENEDIVSALTSNAEVTISPTDALNIARIAKGSYKKAKDLLSENDEHKENYDKFVQIMRDAWKVGNRKDYAALRSLKQWSDDISQSTVGRERQKNFLVYAQHMLRENFILNLQQPELNYLNQTEADFSKNFSPFIHVGNVEDLMAEFALAQKHIEQNVNARMVFFDLALKIIMLLKK
ncbi:MAG: ATP-binding protein [Paludibacter sp.]|jgi:DNA polymerase-3 subunit delta'